jgi:hypothetical protein
MNYTDHKDTYGTDQYGQIRLPTLKNNCLTAVSPGEYSFPSAVQCRKARYSLSSLSFLLRQARQTRHSPINPARRPMIKVKLLNSLELTTVIMVMYSITWAVQEQRRKGTSVTIMERTMHHRQSLHTWSKSKAGAALIVTRGLCTSHKAP